MKKENSQKQKDVKLTYVKNEKGYTNLYLIVDDMTIPVSLTFYNRKLLYKLSKLIDKE